MKELTPLCQDFTILSLPDIQKFLQLHQSCTQNDLMQQFLHLLEYFQSFYIVQTILLASIPSGQLECSTLSATALHSLKDATSFLRFLCKFPASKTLKVSSSAKKLSPFKAVSGTLESDKFTAITPPSLDTLIIVKPGRSKKFN